MIEVISGHKGMATYRTPRGIVQVAHDRDGLQHVPINLMSLFNSAEKMTILQDSGFTPRLLRQTERATLQEDLGDSEPVDDWVPNDWQDFRRALVRCLIDIRQAGIRHGDLNGNNIIIKDHMPWIIDWQESHFIGERPPQISPFSDTYWLCVNLIKWVGNPVVSDPYRVVRRWHNIMSDLCSCHDQSLPLKGMSLLDVGCFQGDFSAFAAAEGMRVVGVDPGSFRHNEESIEIARSLWGGVDNLVFAKGSVHTWNSFEYDVVLFMDTFPYIVRDYGKKKAIEILQQMVAEAGRVYFETQIHGDQSGISWLKNPGDVLKLVPKASWTKVATIPENGVPRTLWRVQCLT